MGPFLSVFAAGLLMSTAVTTSGLSRDEPADILPWSPSSSASHLIFEPAAPMSGGAIHVEYQASAAPAPDRLVLRARFRTPDDAAYNTGIEHVTVGELRRDRGHLFRGSFRLPESVVFGVFAVEHPTADWTDTNAGRFWELLVHGRDGRPLFEALAQRFNDYMGRDVREVLESARLTTHLYPDRPEAWNLRHAAEGWAAGAADADRIREQQRARAAALVARIGSRSDLTPDDLAALVGLSRELPSAAQWRARLESVAPSHPLLLRNRLQEIRRERRGHTPTMLRALEALWNSLPEGRPADLDAVRRETASDGLAAALDAGSLDDLRRWSERFKAHHAPDRAAERFLREATLRDEGIRLANEEIERLQRLSEEDRQLGETPGEQRARHARRTGELRAGIARALAEAGERDRALEELRDAVTLAPTSEHFRALGDLHYETGHVKQALKAWARVAADPATGSEFMDGVRARAGSEFDTETWTDLMDEARRALIHGTLAVSTRRDVSDVDLIDLNGAARRLDSVRTEADAVVVVFVSRFCGFSVGAMPALQALAEQVQPENVKIVPITQDPPTDDDRALYRGFGLQIPVYYDPSGAAWRAFNVWGTPTYVVLDRHRRIRFDKSDLSSLPRQLLALRHEMTGSKPTSPREPLFRSLFDGQTLAGWEGNLEVFRVEDGAIVGGRLEARIPNNEFLCTTSHFEDFELRVQAKLVGPGDNAGIQFRTHRVPNHAYEVSGYQADMGTMSSLVLARMSGREPTQAELQDPTRRSPIWGHLYDESRRNRFLAGGPEEEVRAVLRKDDWNEFVIRAEGPRIRIWLNGLQTVDYVEEDEGIDRAGAICLQIHSGGPSIASYREIAIRELGSL
jgi:tetratricopeptide (TPR) repeat protein